MGESMAKTDALEECVQPMVTIRGPEVRVRVRFRV